LYRIVFVNSAAKIFRLFRVSLPQDGVTRDGPPPETPLHMQAERLSVIYYLWLCFYLLFTSRIQSTTTRGS